MPTINSFTTCPADCATDNLLPAVLVIQDCASYEQVKSQVHTLYIMRQVGGTPSADPFTNFATTPTATAGAVVNTNADNTKAKGLVGASGLKLIHNFLTSREIITHSIEHPGCLPHS